MDTRINETPINAMKSSLEAKSAESKIESEETSKWNIILLLYSIIYTKSFKLK